MLLPNRVNPGGLSLGKLKSILFFLNFVLAIIFHQKNNPNSLSENSIWSVYEDSEGKLWFGTYANGLDRYDPASEKFTNFRYNPNDPNSLGSNCVWTMYEDSRGNFWVGTRGGGLNLFESSYEKASVKLLTLINLLNIDCVANSGYFEISSKIVQAGQHFTVILKSSSSELVILESSINWKKLSQRS